MSRKKVTKNGSPSRLPFRHASISKNISRRYVFTPNPIVTTRSHYGTSVRKEVVLRFSYSSAYTPQPSSLTVPDSHSNACRFGHSRACLCREHQSPPAVHGQQTQAEQKHRGYKMKASCHLLPQTDTNHLRSIHSLVCHTSS